MAKGTVTYYDADGGYGFIETEGADDDVFVHVSDVSGPELTEGEKLEFDIEVNEEGFRARNPERIGSSSERTRVEVSGGEGNSLADQIVDKYPDGVKVDRDQSKYKQVAEILLRVPELRGSDEECRDIVMNMVDTGSTTYYKGRSHYERVTKTPTDDTVDIPDLIDTVDEADSSSDETESTEAATSLPVTEMADDITFDDISPEMRELIAEKTAERLADRLFSQMTDTSPQPSSVDASP